MKYIAPSFLKANASNEVLFLQLSARHVAGYAVRNPDKDFDLRGCRPVVAPVSVPVRSLTIKEIALRQVAGRMKRG